MITRGLAAWLLATVLPDLMFFTGYQPQSSLEKFCDDIPTVGQTVVVLDMQDTELRDMLTEIRIIKDLGTHTRTFGLPVLTDAKLASTGRVAHLGSGEARIVRLSSECP
jgi:hypothetical protein